MVGILIAGFRLCTILCLHVMSDYKSVNISYHYLRGFFCSNLLRSREARTHINHVDFEPIYRNI